MPYADRIARAVDKTWPAPAGHTVVVEPFEPDEDDEPWIDPNQLLATVRLNDYPLTNFFVPVDGTQVSDDELDKIVTEAHRAWEFTRRG